MLVKIISLNGVVYEGEARAAVVPGKEGQLTILSHHIGLITSLKKGRIRLKESAKEKDFDIEEGILDVGPKETKILITPSFL